MLLDMVYSRNWSLEAALPGHDLVDEWHECATQTKAKIASVAQSRISNLRVLATGNWMKSIAFTFHSLRSKT